MARTALKYELEVKENGRVELQVPYPPGAHVTIFVIEDSGNSHSDLISAAESSLSFWDNAYDDEDWNHA